MSREVVLKSVSKSFGRVTAVDDVSLTIPEGSFFSLLGPSGCGKSTTLRLIAGFEQPDAGTILIGGEDVTELPPQRRPTAMVFQNYALFPHMSVGQNVGYGLRVRRVDRETREMKVRGALDLVEMGNQIDVPVTNLSGGQQQRVALARAIAVEPDVLLFDEPLSNLDVALREQTRHELKRMQQMLGTTSIYVTHDQEEALALSDSMVVMRDGSALQSGSPETLYHEPETAFVASFLGSSNIIDGELAERIAGSRAPDGHVLCVRSENMEPDPEGTLIAQTDERQFLGSSAVVFFRCGEVALRMELPDSVPIDEHFRFRVRSWRWVKDDRPAA